MPPGLSSTAFWDVDMTAIDYETQAPFVLQRVFNYGLLADWKSVMAYYGEERVRREATQITRLDKKSLALLAIWLDIPRDEFVCYTKTPWRQSFGDFYTK